MATIAQQNGALKVTTAANEAESLKLASARRSAFSALARVRPTAILEDVTVPRTHLAEMVTFIAKTTADLDLTVGTFGHIGNSNLHPTFLTDEHDEARSEKVHQALGPHRHQNPLPQRHHHRRARHRPRKKPWLKQQLGDASLNLMKQFKQTLDPQNLLNPHKIFD